ncbi:MAG: DUF3120 domain-containing protein [Leptolyngbyaceae bacterium]|nr:DUF3120 domain-containing protein [Leptolyngbyaceae bacterium]
MLKRLYEPTWLFFGASVFLVSVPVFFQAPLVRVFPVLSLLITGIWFWLSWVLSSNVKTRLMGNLLDGFAWTWLAGSIYWGWFRAEPLLHLPLEAIGLPIALLGILTQKNKVGSWFYLGSLFGTAMTDVYFYVVGLIPHWRQLMQVDISLATPIFHDAVTKMSTVWGIGWAIAIVAILLMASVSTLRLSAIHWRVFSGAVLSTVLVDGLFWIAVTSA